MPKQLNFSVEGATLDLFADLKKVFEVQSNAAVLKRALALAKLAADNRRDDCTITFLGKDEIRRDVVLNA